MIGTKREFDNHIRAVNTARNLKGENMKPKFTEYERRQIQAMMRQQMPWRKNLVLGSDGVINWQTACGEKRTQEFDPYSILGPMSSRWHCQAFFSNGEINGTHYKLKRHVIAQIGLLRTYNVTRIVVTDQLKNEQYVIENTLPTGIQVMDLLDTLETEFKMTAQEMGELTHIVGGWSPNAWDNRSWGERYNRMKALWREVAKIIGQFTMALKGYDIFKMHGFDGHFVGFTEK